MRFVFVDDERYSELNAAGLISAKWGILHVFVDPCVFFEAIGVRPTWTRGTFSSVLTETLLLNNLAYTQGVQASMKVKLPFGLVGSCVLNGRGR